MLSFIDLDLCDHVLMKSFHVGNHTTGGNCALICEDGGLAILSRNNAESFRDSGISCDGDKVFSGNGYRID